MHSPHEPKSGTWNANARESKVCFDADTRDIQRTERRHKGSTVHRPFLAAATPPAVASAQRSAPPMGASLHACNANAPDTGNRTAVSRQMAGSGLGVDENGAFSAELHRPGMRADGRAQADFHVMRGSQGSMANTSSWRMHGRYHVDTSILRNLARCSVDADADLLKMLDMSRGVRCMSQRQDGAVRFGPACARMHRTRAEVVCNPRSSKNLMGQAVIWAVSTPT